MAVLHPAEPEPDGPGMLFCRAQRCASRSLADESLTGHQLSITSSMDCFRSGCQQELGGCLRRAGAEAARVSADLAELWATSRGGSVASVTGFEAGSISKGSRNRQALPGGCEVLLLPVLMGCKSSQLCYSLCGPARPGCLSRAVQPIPIAIDTLPKILLICGTVSSGTKPHFQGREVSGLCSAAGCRSCAAKDDRRTGLP